MMAKGQKRKFPWEFGAYENQRQCVLDISLCKFQHMHTMLETSLRCKVLVGNTLRKIQEEIYLEDILTKETNALTASSPFASAEIFPQFDNSAFPENPSDAWSILSSEEELSLLSAINYVLNDTCMGINGPQPQPETPLGSSATLAGGSSAPESLPLETGILGSFDIIPPFFLSDVEMNNPFRDSDTSAFPQEMAYLESQLFGGAVASNAVSISQVSHSQNSRDLSELDHIMDILVGS